MESFTPQEVVKAATEDEATSLSSTAVKSIQGIKSDIDIETKNLEGISAAETKKDLQPIPPKDEGPKLTNIGISAMQGIKN